MPKKTFTLEQIVAKLRQVEVLVSEGKTVPLACKEAGIVDQTYYRWQGIRRAAQVEQTKKAQRCRGKTRSCGVPSPIRLGKADSAGHCGGRL
jgi:hypothetical protein